MQEVINTKPKDHTVIASEIFNSLLAKYVTIDCAKNGQGNLVCTISAKNIRNSARPKEHTFMIHKSDLDNYGYVHAVIEKRMRDILYSISFYEYGVINTN